MACKGIWDCIIFSSVISASPAHLSWTKSSNGPIWWLSKQVILYYLFFLLFQKTRYFPMLTLPHQYAMFTYFPMHGLMKWKSPALQNTWCSCIFQFRTCIEKYVICQVLDFFKFWSFQGWYFKFWIFLSGIISIPNFSNLSFSNNCNNCKEIIFF